MRIKQGHKMNGTFSECLVIGPKDNFFINTVEKYDYFEVTNNKIQPVIDVIEQSKSRKNIIIDDRLILHIAYLSFKYTDLLIYNTKSSSIETFFQHINERYLQRKVGLISLQRARMILFVYAFSRLICKYKPFQWNLGLAIASIKNTPSKMTGIDLDVLLTYFEKLRIYSYQRDDKNIFDVKSCLSISDQETMIPENYTQRDIIYNILTLSKTQRFIIL